MEEWFDKELPQRTFAPAPRADVLEDRSVLADYLLNPGLLDDSSWDGVSDIHLYAHGRPGTGLENTFAIRFEYPKRRRRLFGGTGVVEIRSLEFYEAATRARTEPLDQERPLLWFNCCKASGVVGEELFSVDVVSRLVVAPLSLPALTSQKGSLSPSRVTSTSTSTNPPPPAKPSWPRA